MTPLEQLAFWLSHKQPVLLHGPSGEGKSYVGKRVKTNADFTTAPELVKEHELAQAHPNGVVCISMTPETEESPLYGEIAQRLDDGRFVHREGPITRAYRNGMRLVVNEITTSPADIAHLWHPIANREPIVVKSGGYEEIEPAPGFELVGTTNLEGYGGNYRLSPAFYSRWQAIYWPAATAEELLTQYSEEFPNLDPLTIADFIELKNKLSTVFAAKDAPAVISRRELTRACIMTDYLQKSGLPDAAARALVLTVRENINIAAPHLALVFDTEAEKLTTIQYDRSKYAQAA